VFFACLVLAHVGGVSYWKRVLLVVWISLAAFAAQTFPLWNWYSFSTAFTLAELLDAVVGFFLAGMVIAKILPSRVR
jgi:hypothetical protein